MWLHCSIMFVPTGVLQLILVILAIPSLVWGLDNGPQARINVVNVRRAQSRLLLGWAGLLGLRLQMELGRGP